MVDRHDNFMAVTDRNMKSEEGFTREALPTRSVPYANKFHTLITFEVSLTRYHYIRSVDRLFDLLGNIGGLSGALGSICVIIISTVNHFGSYKFVM